MLVAVAVLSMVALAGFLVWDLVGGSPSRDVDRIALAEVPDGPSLQRVGDRAVVLVRDGDDVTAFPAATSHNADPLVWCADDGTFSTALYASRYDLDGRRLGGPGPDALLRLDTKLAGDHVEIGAGYAFDWPRTDWSTLARRQFEDFTGNVC